MWVGANPPLLSPFPDLHIPSSDDVSKEGDVGAMELAFFGFDKQLVLQEAEGRIPPAARQSSMYVFIALVSGPDSEYSRPRGGVVPGRILILQS
jgi:hypothetical protein